MTRSGVLLTESKMLGEAVKHCLGFFYISSEAKLKLKRKQRNAIVKIRYSRDF